MSIINDQQMGAINDALAQINDQNIREIINVKSFGDLTPGDRFKATIADIYPNRLTLKLTSGDMLTARTLMLPDARIGDESIFLVKENVKGQILLEMMKPNEQAAQANIVREALNSAGLRQTPENTQLAREMLKSNLPLDSASLQKAMFFNYAEAAMTVDKVIFLMKEQFPMTESNVNILDRLMDREHGLTADIKTLVNVLRDFPDIPLRDELTDLVAGFDRAAKPNQSVEKKIIDRFFINIKEKNALERFDGYYKELVEIVSKFGEKLTDAVGKQPELAQACDVLAAAAEAVKDNVTFMNHISQYKTYIQIPFTMDGTQSQGELFVWKDGRGGSRKGDALSALIALNGAYIGRVEAFLTKSGRALSFQVKGDSDDTLTLINQNSGLLLNALREKGYTISGFSLKRITEPFTAASDWGAKNSKPAAQKRYSFDMRV